MKWLGQYKLVVLILLTVVLYGLIGIRIKETIIDEKKYKPMIFNKPEQTFNETITKDSVNTDYRNPFFLKENCKRNTNNSKKHFRKVKHISRKETSKEWPKLKLNAIIIGEQNRLCVIVVNDKETILKEKDQYQECTIKTIYKDSVIIVFNNKEKVLR